MFYIFNKNDQMMGLLALVLTGIVAIEHIYILWLEMFAWESRGRVVFKDSLPQALFTPTRTLAANQGLYNGFLAAGLAWSIFISDQNWQFNVSVFFLSCVIIAGIYGAITASRKIFLVQALPAIIALLFVVFAR
jgi:putative membrane protein